MTSEFDRAIAVTEITESSRDRSVHGISVHETSSRSSISYDAAIAPGWDILGNANGGYLMALAARALTDATGRPDCFTITAHYLAPCPPSPVRIDVRPVRSGRRFGTATASVFLVDRADHAETPADPGRVPGREALRVLATLGDLASDPGGPTSMSGTRPDITPWGDCPVVSDTSINSFAFIHDRLATRIDPRDAGFRNGSPTGAGTMRGWFAFKDDRPIDSTALLLAADAFPPPAFNLDLPTNWVPTLELTVHVRAIPAPGPVACFFRTRFVQNGLLEADGEIWDTSGVLVAQSRQLALAPRA